MSLRAAVLPWHDRHLYLPVLAARPGRQVQAGRCGSEAIS